MSTDAGTPGRWPEGFDRIVLESVDSTNSEAARRAPHLERPTWITAHRQTAARGRRGSVWDMPEGNLAATLVLRPACAPGHVALHSFVAANALFEALALYVDRTRLANKWPNDVLLDQGKVAGILLEGTGSGGTIDWLSIGIGVNLARAPVLREASAFAPVSLGEQGGDAVAPADFLTELAGIMATELAIFARLGFGAVREKWLRRAARLGAVITARTGTQTVEGRFKTIDDSGQLVLETGAGTRLIPAADIFF